MKVSSCNKLNCQKQAEYTNVEKPLLLWLTQYRQSSYWKRVIKRKTLVLCQHCEHNGF